MDEQVANFIAVTGATEVQAFQMLEATGHDLEHAVQLFFAAGGDVGSGAGATDQGAGPSSSEAAPHNHHHNDDEAFARQLEQQDRGEEEPQVRAPLPSKVERLYGDFYQYDASHALRQQSQARNPVPAQVVDAFRDFSGEGGEDGGGGGGGAGDTPRATNTLASMFEPPRDLLFNGTFEQAKAFAANEGKWIIVNLQSTSQFASHQLNRDTWRDPTVHALVQSSFTFYQAYDITDEGQKLLTFYKAYEIPVTLVLDPVTGAPMKQWVGYVTAERMIENLMPFMDTHFSDPGAARLAASMKRKQSGLSARGSHQSANAAAAAATAAAALAEDEDTQLQAAIQASMVQEDRSVPPGSGTDAVMKEEEKERVNAEEVAEAASARLPPEPPAPEGCRIGVRFPDGSRGQRRFPREAPLRALYDWCLSRSLEAAGGREFTLSEAAPGSIPLTEFEASLEGVGVADAMLVMKWS